MLEKATIPHVIVTILRMHGWHAFLTFYESALRKTPQGSTLESIRRSLGFLGPAPKVRNGPLGAPRASRSFKKLGNQHANSAKVGPEPTSNIFIFRWKNNTFCDFQVSLFLFSRCRHRFWHICVAFFVLSFAFLWFWTRLHSFSSICLWMSTLEWQ